MKGCNRLAIGIQQLCRVHNTTSNGGTGINNASQGDNLAHLPIGMMLDGDDDMDDDGDDNGEDVDDDGEDYSIQTPSITNHNQNNKRQKLQ